jgi:CxxC motif-containing protein (DUF1111 family)
LFALVLILVAAILVKQRLRVPEPGDPVPFLSMEERARFERGREEFENTFSPDSGLGPLFNSEACGECHESPVAGGTGDEVETHVAAYYPDGFCDLLANEGGPVVQQRTTPALARAMGIDREPTPRSTTVIAMRTTPDVFGFGLLDAVPDSLILALADPDDHNGDGISGRPNRFLDGRIGRFGRKAFVPHLSEFNHGAFVAEQGITNPDVSSEENIGGLPIPDGVDPTPEPEIDQRTMELVDDFMRFLAPPAPRGLSASGRRGREIFHKIGCQSCHVPTLVTGNHPVRALRYRRITAYTDLLLHDMGPELADICFGEATPSEFRTEPLMGLRFSDEPEEGEPHFLHDGRAKSVEEAIRLHGGEAQASRDRFIALSETERRALVEFLKSL